MSYSIKQVAEMMGVTPSTLRYYDQEGLLPNVKRVNGIRVFEDLDFKWLRVLNCLKNTNMPIKKIKEYCDLAQKGDKIEYKEWYYEEAIRQGSEKELIKQIPDNPTLDVDKIPKKGRK